MTWEEWLTLGVVAVCIGLLASNRYAPDIVLVAGLTLHLALGGGHRGPGTPRLAVPVTQ